MRDTGIAEGEGAVVAPVVGGSHAVEVGVCLLGLFHQGLIFLVVGHIVGVGPAAEHLPDVQHGGLGIVAQLPGGEAKQHQGDHRGQLPSGEGGWQGRQHLASQSYQEEGEDKAVPIGEPVGHFEEVPHLVQGGQPQREHQHHQHRQSGQLVPAGNGGVEEKDQGQHQDHRAAEQIGQGGVGQSPLLAGEQSAGQLPQREIGEAGVVHGGISQLTAEDGQQGGDPHPGGDP